MSDERMEEKCFAELGHIMVEAARRGLPIVITRVGRAGNLTVGLQSCYFTLDREACETALIVARGIADRMREQGLPPYRVPLETDEVREFRDPLSQSSLRYQHELERQRRAISAIEFTKHLAPEPRRKEASESLYRPIARVEAVVAAPVGEPEQAKAPESSERDEMKSFFFGK